MAKPFSPLDVPASDCTVDISIINTTATISNVKTSSILEPPIGSFDAIDLPVYSFLIENQAQNQKILFDLGVRKDWQNIPKPILERISAAGWGISVDLDVADILSAQNTLLESINAIIWSHCHFDHIGDPSTFPPSTELVVGPDGARRAKLGPPIDRATDKPRKVRELNPAQAKLCIGGFRALDYFGDGSFFLLFAPGHTADHLCALARTTGGENPSFMFMAADAVHHAGEHRPSRYIPLPEEIKPNPLGHNDLCPGDMFESLHPHGRTDLAFQHAKGGEDKVLARETVDKMVGFDAHDEIICVGAHDRSLLHVVDFFPAKANAWREKGWRQQVFWKFINDYTKHE